MSDSQTLFATLGAPIGVVSQLSGSVIIQSVDGKERVVKVGDPVFYGETVVTGQAGAVTIKFIDGTDAVIGDNSIVEMNDEVYTPANVDDLAEDSATDISALQQAIADGADPTLIQEAPAAGDDAATGEQDRYDVSIDRTNDESLPSYGYDTQTSTRSTSDRTLSVSLTDSNNASLREAADDADTTATSAPTIAIAGDTNEDGVYNANELGEDGTVTATISIPADAVAGDTVTYQVDDAAAVSVVLTDALISSGITVEIEPDATITATITDVAGNTSTEATATAADADTTATSAPTIAIAGDTNEDGVYNANELGEDGTVTATISIPADAVAGDTVTYQVDDAAAVSVVLTDALISSGITVEIEPDATITASITDAAGNTSLEISATALAENQGPIAAEATGSVDEDASITGSVSATDIDLPADANLTFTTTSTVTGLTF
ncbi:MAG: retention module-containing protein, partial [Marinomonadaceae bacterium]